MSLILEKIKFLQRSHTAGSPRQGRQGENSTLSSPTPHCPGKYPHLSFYVKNNHKYMQLDEHNIIQQIIKLRILVSKNTKYCDGELACS
ncbi:hypothetical protein [Nostoc sp. S13]|uniref:hypothetical protein n=1 Tax=Nostoc sp. S13 TaxID=3019266 RepID=UPI002601A27C|nr:hypothetical protein [Nostoc sp. S13]